MRLKVAIVALGLAALAACGGGTPEGVVKFYGLTPTTSGAMTQDARGVATYCPGPCQRSMEVGTPRCPDRKNCDVKIRWREDYRCAYCAGTSVCRACEVMEQPDGSCYYCKGAKTIAYAGKAPECSNCKGTGKCPVCKGTRKCDWCEGSGKVGGNVVKDRAAKRAAASKEEPEEKPAVPKAEEKKAEETKP